MGALIGFLVGYALGTQAGPESLEQLRRAWEEIAASDEFKGLTATATAFLENALAEASGTVAEEAKQLTTGTGNLGEMWRTISGSGNIIDVISKSAEFQNVFAAGISVVGGVLEQGMAMLGERSTSRPRFAGRP